MRGGRGGRSKGRKAVRAAKKPVAGAGARDSKSGAAGTRRAGVRRGSRLPRGAAAVRERPAAIGEMARMIAHEVRNALSVMYNVATGLRRSLPRSIPDGEMLLGILEEELGRLDRLTRDLVTFATPAAPVRADVRVRELLERAVAEARRRCTGGAQARVTVTVAPEASSAPLDPDRMLEAMVGLLENGIDASNGRGKVEVRATREGRMLRFEVIDEGPGISPEETERIFDPFYTTKASGVGLGLVLCRQIARRHGGELRVLPAPHGTGACFRLEIPLDEGGGEP